MQFWIVWRYMSSGRKFFNLTSIFAMGGLALGVAVLVSAMSIVSGFETTLKRSAIEVTGHLNIVRRGGVFRDSEKFRERIFESTPEIKGLMSFLQFEGVIAHKKKVAGVLVEGLGRDTLKDVLALEKRVIDGKLSLGAVKIKDAKTGETKKVTRAVVGKGVAKKFGLKVGESFKVIRPVSSQKNPSVLAPKIREFQLAGVLDLGKFEYNDRFVLTDLAVAQNFREVGERVFGYRARLDKESGSRDVALRLESELGYPFVVKDWYDVNRNLMEAIRLEKPVLFFVVLIMVIAAGFNVCSHLFTSVLRRYSDIGILRTMGASRRFIMWLFALQGMVLGVIGSLGGILLGLLLSWIFSFAQKYIEILPGSVYKIGFVMAEVRAFDLLLVFISSLIICFLATLAPAIRGSRLIPVEGLRYD